MENWFTKHKTWVRIIAIGVVCLFLINEFAFAIEDVSSKKGAYTLSPVSRIRPIVTIEENDGELTVVENEQERSRLTDEFQEDAGFVYLSTLITQVLQKFGPRISAEGLKNLIAKHLSHIDFTNFKWQEIYKEDDTFCLPYVRKDDGRMQILKFYLPKDEDPQFPHKVALNFDDGSAAILEDPVADLPEHFKRSRETATSIAGQGILSGVDLAERGLKGNASADIKDLSKDGRLSCNMILVEKSERDREALGRALYDKYQGSLQVVTERSEDVEGRILHRPQEELEKILSERASHNFLVIIDPAKLHPVSREDVERVPGGAYRSYIEMRFSYGIRPEAFKAVMVPKELIPVIADVFPPHVKIIEIDGTKQKELEALRMEPIMVGGNRLGEESRTRMVNIKVPDYETALSDYLDGMRRGEKLLTHIVRLTAPSDIEHAQPEEQENSSGEEDDSGKDAGGSITLRSVALPALATALLNSAEAIDPLVVTLLGVIALVALPMVLYHAGRFFLGIMIEVLNPKQRIAAEFVLGAVLIGTGIHLGFGQIVPSFAEYIASPLLCSAGACLITFGAYELIKKIIVKHTAKEEDTPNLGSINSYDLASHELLRRHLKDAMQFQAWGQEVEGVSFSEYYHDRLAEAGITLPEDLNLIIIKHYHGDAGSLEQKFLYFEPGAEKWIFSHAGTRKGTGKFVYLTEEALYLLTHNVRQYPGRKYFLEELLAEEYEHATLKLAGRWDKDAHKLCDSSLAKYVEKNFNLYQLRLAGPVGEAISGSWSISGSIIKLFVDFHLKGKIPPHVEAAFLREAAEAADLGTASKIMVSNANSPDYMRERVLSDIKILARYSLAQARHMIDFIDDMAKEIPGEIREGEDFRNLVAFFERNLSDAEVCRGVIDDEHGQYDEENISRMAKGTIKFLKSLKQFDHTDIVFETDAPEATVIADTYLLRWQFIAAVLREFDRMPEGRGRIKVGYRKDATSTGIEFVAENPAQRARWISKVKDECSRLNDAFYHELRKEYRRDEGACFDASYVLARVLSKRLGLPIDGESPDRIEVEVGEYPSRGALKPSMHAWVVVYSKGERALLVDPTRGQYNEEYYNRIFAGEYKKSIEDLDLVGPDELREKGGYRTINDILFSQASRDLLDLMSRRVLEDLDLVRMIRERVDLGKGSRGTDMPGQIDSLIGANTGKIIRQAAFTIADIKRGIGENSGKETRVRCIDEKTSAGFDLVLDILYHKDTEEAEIAVKISTSDMAKILQAEKPGTSDMLIVWIGRVSLKTREPEAEDYPLWQRKDKHVQEEEQNRQIIDGIFRALGVKTEDLDWREENGLAISRVPVSSLKEQEIKLAFDLPEASAAEGELIIICQGTSPMFLCLASKKKLIRTVNLMPYYADLSEETSAAIMRKLDARFPIMEFVGNVAYSYAVFNDWGGLIEIRQEHPSAKKYHTPVHVVRVPVLPGVYGGTHASSEISARATAEYAAPGKKVLVVGTGKGLEARIAALRGATVDAVDIRELAAENTRITCSLGGVSDKVNAFCNDLFTGLGEYDLIIFNMPHTSDEPAVYSSVTSAERNTSDFGGDLLNRVADEIAGHIAPGGKAVLVNSESYVIEKMLKEKTKLAVSSDFFDVAGESQAYVIEKPGPDRDKIAGVLRLPSPRGYIPDMQEKIEWARRNICQPLEKDESTVINEKDIPWAQINAYMRQKKLDVCGKNERPVVHVVDISSRKGKDLFGFPLVPGHEEFSELVPVISYSSASDGRLHVFMTAGFHDDYLEVSHMRTTRSARTLRVVRFAEILDHEIFEHSDEALSLPEGERHHIAALRARYFIPRGQKISAFHKWVLDSLALTGKGREHVMLLLDEGRMEPEKSSQRKYEKDFYDYARGVLPRKEYSDEVQRASHHLLRVYKHGDVRGFEEMCTKVGVDPETLGKEIEAEEKKHVINAVEGFNPDIVITETSETTVEIDNTKAIVRKSLKNKYADFIWDDMMKNKHGPECLTVLLEMVRTQGKDLFYDERMAPVIEYAFRLLEQYDSKLSGDARDKPEAVFGLVADYMDQLEILASYLRAQQRLGGLIADFTIADGRIYQEKVTPLTVYLQQLISGTGPFADLKDKSFENKVKIGWDVLEKYIECIQEIARRGAVVCNVKLTNFGVRDNGEVVLFDLGRSSLGWHDAGSISTEFGLTLFGTKIAMDARRLENLNAEGVVEETGVRQDFGDDEEARKIQTELARVWTELIAAKPIGKGDTESVKMLDGREFTEKIEEMLPKTPEEAEPEYRRITFIPNEIAEEEIFQLIMKHVDRGKNKEAASPPKGSIHGVFEYLCRNDITSPEAALQGDLIADNIGRQFGTIKYDLRALYYHLHLVEKVDAKETGRNARYYVPERVKKKARRILPVLARFVGDERVPKVSLLEEIYEKEIAPILQQRPRMRHTINLVDGKPPVILLQGWPGSGKTTLGKALSAELGIPHISVGELIKQQRERSPDFDPGLLGSNDYVYGLLLESALKDKDLSRGVIIDDSPRTPDSIDVIKDRVEEKGLKLGAIIELAISRKMEMRRKIALPQLEKWREKGLVCSLDAEAEQFILEARAIGELRQRGVISIHPDSIKEIEKSFPPKKDAGIIEVGGKMFRLETATIGESYKSLEVFDLETGKRAGFFYAMAGDQNSPECADVCGIRGIYLESGYRGLGLSSKMMEIFFRKFGDVDMMLEEVMNPVLIHMAKEHFGFLPVDPAPGNRVYVDLKPEGEGKPKIWIPDGFLRLSYSTGPPETMRTDFEVLQEEPGELDGFEKIYFRTAYRRVYPASLGLEGVDAVIADFDGVDRDHGTNIVSEDTIAAKKGLSRRGVHNITITGLEQGRLFERFGGIKRASMISTRDDYIALTCSGAIANRVTRDGQVVELQGFQGVSLGDSKTKRDIARIAKKALLTVCREKGMPQEAAEKIEEWIKDEQVTLLTRGDERVNAIRYDIAETIRKELKRQGFPPNIVVSASAGAVDISSTSKGKAAIQMIKLLKLKKVILIGDSAGTEERPGNDRSLLVLTQKDLQAAGIDWAVELIPVYVGREEYYSLPGHVIVAPQGERESDAALNAYKAVIKAQDEVAIRALAKDKVMKIWGALDKKKLARWLRQWQEVYKVRGEINIRRLSRDGLSRTLSFGIGEHNCAVTFDVTKDMDTGKVRLTIKGMHLQEVLREKRLMSILTLYLVQLYKCDEVYHERMNERYGEKFFEGLKKLGIYSNITYLEIRKGRYKDGLGVIDKARVKKIIYNTDTIKKFLAKSEDSRGWEGLPNEGYTREIRKAIDSGNIFVVSYDGEKIMSEDVFLHEERGQMPIRDLGTRGDGLRAINEAVEQLNSDDKKHLKGIKVVFFEGERDAHYSLSRGQIYINLRFQDSVRALRRILHHELVERTHVIANMDRFDPLWRRKRGEGMIEEAIRDFAGKIHRSLKEAERGIIVKTAEEFLDVAEHPVTEVRSFRDLLMDTIGDRDEVTGVDLGAGFGEKTKEVMALLEKNFSSVSYTGIDKDDHRAKYAMSHGAPVVPYSVEDYMKSDLYNGGKDLVTAFSIYPGVIEEFVNAAKQMVAEDGIVVISLTASDMDDLLRGRKVYNNVDAEKVWSLFSDFELVKFTETHDWLQVESDTTANPFAFVYRPGGKKVEPRKKPGYEHIEIREWLDQDEIVKISRKYGDKIGLTPVTTTSGAQWVDTIRDYLPEIPAGTTSFSSDLDGAEVLVVGPGKDAEEVFRFLEYFPGIKAIHVVSADELVFKSMESRASELARQRGFHTKLYGYKLNVMELPEELEGRIDLAFHAYVFTDERDGFSLSQRRQAGREIAGALKPSGAAVYPPWFTRISKVEGIYDRQESMTSFPEIFMPLTLMVKETEKTRQAAAARFVDEMIIKAFEAGKQGQDIIIGVDTSWIPDMQGVQAVLNELSRISRRKGFGNVHFLRGRGVELAGLISKRVEKTGTALSNVIVLAEQNVLRSDVFDGMRSTEREEKAFMAGVDTRNFNDKSYTRLFEMLTLAVELASSDREKASMPGVSATRIGPRSWIFIPEACPMDLEQRKATYEAQLQALIAA